MSADPRVRRLPIRFEPEAILLQRGIIREVAQRIGDAAVATCRSLEVTEVEQEPAFTDRFLGRLDQTVEGFTKHGIVWRSKTLTDRGPGAQEHEFGADFLGVLDIDIPGERVQKGFLAQAKLAYQGRPLTRSEFVRLQAQARDMLDISPVAFVFGYSTTNVIVVPATAIIASSERNLHRYHHRGVSSFFEEHLACFIGDYHLRAATRAQLDHLLAERRVRKGLLLTARAA
jgi:hypothetical protein